MKLSLFLIALLFLTSCSNRTVNGVRQGYWKETDTVNGIPHVSKGRYRDGMPVKTWKYFANGKLVKKEQYNGDDCLVSLYGPDKTLELTLMAKLVREENTLHWFYVSDWTTYDVFGNTIYIDTYYRGELVGEKEIN